MTIKTTITLETTIEVKEAKTQAEAEKLLDDVTMTDVSNGYGCYSMNIEPLQPILQDTDLIMLEYDKADSAPEFVFDGKTIHRL